MSRHAWTDADDALLRAEYGKTRSRDLAAKIGVTMSSIHGRAKKLDLQFPPLWSAERVEQLRKLYPTHSAAECAQIMGMTVDGIHYAAHRYGMSKPREWIVENSRKQMERPDHPARKSRFQAGMTPHNKGKPHPTRGRAAETQFKPGMRPHTWNPIGHERESKEGYLQRKVSDTGVTRRDYVGIHHLVWRMRGMQIPAGHALVFRDGDKRNFDINNLELVARAELMRRNSVHRHGPEIARAYQLIGAVKRQINKHTKEQRA